MEYTIVHTHTHTHTHTRRKLLLGRITERTFVEVRKVIS